MFLFSLCVLNQLFPKARFSIVGIYCTYKCSDHVTHEPPLSKYKSEHSFMNFLLIMRVQYWTWNCSSGSCNNLPELQMEFSFFFPFPCFFKLTGCGSKSFHEFAVIIYFKIYEFFLNCEHISMTPMKRCAPAHITKYPNKPYFPIAGYTNYKILRRLHSLI